MANNAGHNAEWRGDRLLIFVGFFIPIQVICVALRYLAGRLAQRPWGLDDLLVFTSLALQMALAGLSIGAVKLAGVGYHLAYLQATDPGKAIVWGIWLVPLSTLYFANVNVPRLAILALYRRLFSNKSNRTVINILMAISIGLEISTVVTNLAACRPFAANWEPTMPGAHCINKENFFRWGSFPNIVTDIIMLGLPVRVVWNLQTTTRLKIGLTITFLVGSAGLITSIIRFTFFFADNSFADGTWAGVNLIIIAQMEPGIYLVSACLMTYRPLLEGLGRANLMRNPKAAIGQHTGEPKKQNSDIPLTSWSNFDNSGFHRLANDVQIDPHIFRTTNINVTSADRASNEDIEGFVRA